MKEENKVGKLSDKAFRAQLRKDPKQHIGKLFGNNSNVQDIEIVVKTNTKNMMYIVFPSSNSNIDLDMLGSVYAANTAFGTASTLASAGSLSSTASTVSTGFTASTL